MFRLLCGDESRLRTCYGSGGSETSKSTKQNWKIEEKQEGTALLSQIVSIQFMRRCFSERLRFVRLCNWFVIRFRVHWQQNHVRCKLHYVLRLIYADLFCIWFVVERKDFLYSCRKKTWCFNLCDDKLKSKWNIEEDDSLSGKFN